MLEDSNAVNPNDYLNYMIDKSSEGNSNKNSNMTGGDNLCNRLFHKTYSIV